jgi:hypothetical protein
MSHKHESDRPNNQDELPAELTALERELAAFTPAAPRLDRDRLMFVAGRASADAARGGHRFVTTRFWQAATAISTAASITLAVILIGQSMPPRVQPVMPTFIANEAPITQANVQLVSTTGPSGGWLVFLPAWIEPAQPTSGYLARRNAVLTFGPAALERDATRLSASGGTSSAGPINPPTARELLDEFLPPSERITDNPILTP